MYKYRVIMKFRDVKMIHVAIIYFTTFLQDQGISVEDKITSSTKLATDFSNNAQNDDGTEEFLDKSCDIPLLYLLKQLLR